LAATLVKVLAGAGICRAAPVRGVDDPDRDHRSTGNTALKAKISRILS
jgi:hypothetical protein